MLTNLSKVALVAAIILFLLMQRSHSQMPMLILQSNTNAIQAQETPATAPRQDDEQTWNGMTARQLISHYDCSWVREERKFYSDAELRQKAKDLHLPSWLVAMAERCPK